MITTEYIKVYDEVKRVILITEKINDTFSLPILGEYRNAFDHLINFLRNKNKTELENSILYLKRAAIDSYYLTVSILNKEIEEAIKRIGIKDFNRKFPDFKTSILPKIQKFRNEAVHGTSEIDSFDELIENLNLIIEFKTEIKTIRDFSKESEITFMFWLKNLPNPQLKAIIVALAVLISTIISLILKIIV